MPAYWGWDVGENATCPHLHALTRRRYHLYPPPSRSHKGDSTAPVGTDCLCCRWRCSRRNCCSHSSDHVAATAAAGASSG